MPMQLFFTQLFALEQKQIAYMADEKSLARISHRPFAASREEMRNSAKNNADAIIFRTAICFRMKVEEKWQNQYISQRNPA
ncbi:MAG: hypothetical protein SPL51_06940 [Lachnospiraceae bacterium]|nr:hypothetical protein [Lachnospiraceae bacterium]